MLEIVSWFVIYFTMHLLDCYVFSKLIKEKYKFNFIILIAIVFISIFDCTILVKQTGILRMIVSNLITFAILKIIYKKNISKTLMGTIFTYIGYIVADLLFYVIFLLIFNIDINGFQNSIQGIIVVNSFDFLIYGIIFSIKPFTNFVSKIISWYDDKKIFKLIISSLLAIIICYIIFYSTAFNKIIQNYELIIISIFLGIVVFIFGYFKEKSSNNKLTVEYTQLLEYVKDYEKEVVEKGKRQHEYKNQLIVINDMIPKSNKKLKKYVEDKLEIEENIKDNIWLEKLTNLPSGGIKGLIYYKLKKMIENNIDVYIDVDEELSDEKKWFNIDKNLEDYTRIIGVYLDNAIEASTESKDKQIIIEFIENKDNIEFILSNTYNGVINYQEIDKEKFSTKGNGRGYGLSLVKEIIEKNKLLNQTREVNGKFYVQKLTIKK